MIKFYFTFKIIKNESKNIHLPKKVTLFRHKSEALREQKAKVKKAQFRWENTSHDLTLVSRKKARCPINSLLLLV